MKSVAEQRLLLAMIVGIVAGGLSGFLWGEAMLSVKWLGDLFLTMLKMLIVPLVAASVITGVAGLGDVRRLGRMGAYSVAYYLCTTLIAVSIGLMMANLWQPGVGVSLGADLAASRPAAGDIGVTDLILSLVHPNIIAAAADMKLLPIIVFCIVFAAALSTLGERGKPVIAFFEGLNDGMMKLVEWIMWLAPLGVFALIASRLGAAGGGEAFLGQLAGLAKYAAAVISGLLTHAAVLCLVLAVLARQHIGAYLKHMAAALITAFSTASSSATLPLTMEGVKLAGVDEKARRFVLPLGATINMDGTALYEAVAVLFIAQAYGIDLSFGQQMVVLLTATMAAIGAAGIPEAGLVTMVIVLEAVGLPLEGIGLLLAIDWFLDRCRTTINVFGDSVGAAVVGRFAPGG
ncbi:MAG: sodium:dicarboxylate symporter [Zetaproteobacteria bacterium CG12_big_fil_rev_8_21_14_0_65_55_1124]|nr:MAG: sodium:dicarboxylate symporter [Zetaproteobacteria bacterium CG1_02_55_237]PIS19216.1 MAG: sodium:dicarboxylate symporter [Zetaproteobacteria bacterium CG08_land_8_20_14_0_20_55_17]PIW42924.1 MAG: sodium:dicarboxylate symporter [Zetaproteobacteria bacterium CG12_big_fil_rev_8_21_14_0_65_55_1124]PIY51853.1 MAG: sodium:dicarboxylate symporter [Zetaproteobacteria bacterium CG_4_10_14_0_8_um_filter_55_43]PIZ39913.1 MAG: sodium:dicarboxylate symporter [Zetaproteobacteria bacterium CG_4_10_14